ncbi:MAG: peptidylprolyl isomerase [Pseudomonadota bacterium]
MSSTLSASVNERLDPLAKVSSGSRWLREPLLHFMVLGGLLFAVDHYLISRSDDPRTIMVGAEVDAEARQVFKASRGREPDADELTALRRVWLDNEVLYREGLALQVDKGDTAIRERVIFKALSVVDANTKLPPVDEQVLRTWFESHRAKYDEPPRYDFQEAVLSGDSSEAAVRAFVATLTSGTSGEADAGLRVFKGRPKSNLLQSYGAEFTKALEESPAGEWRAHKTRDGWRAIRLDSISKPQAASFEALRSVVLQDWTDATLSEQRSAAVRALAKKYQIKFEGASK